MQDDLSNQWSSLKLELIEPGVFKPGFVIELTGKECGQLIVRRYFVSEYESLMDEDIEEFPIYEEKQDKKNILKFLRRTKKKIERDFGESKIYLDKAAAQIIKDA